MNIPPLIEVLVVDISGRRDVSAMFDVEPCRKNVHPELG